MKIRALRGLGVMATLGRSFWRAWPRTIFRSSATVTISARTIEARTELADVPGLLGVFDGLALSGGRQHGSERRLGPTATVGRLRVSGLRVHLCVARSSTGTRRSSASRVRVFGPPRRAERDARWGPRARSLASTRGRIVTYS
jgi:hypothetical protein